jgi:hypothetical protein
MSATTSDQGRAGLLFSQMQPPPGWEADFHDWYETEHIPARMEIPGFTEAIRYELLDGDDDAARFLACYFLHDMGALETDVYRRLKTQPSERTGRMLGNVTGFTRYLTDQISDTGASADDADPERGCLYVVAFAVPEQEEPEFEDWYEGEHVPLLMKVPGWRRIRRFRVRHGGDGPAWTHLALHELRGVEVLDAPERAAARDTDKRRGLACRPWFTSGRWVYRPIHRAVASTPPPSHETTTDLEN